MTQKLIVVIFVFTLAALELLAVRQAQINTVHKMEKLHQKIERQISSLDVLRFKIEAECSFESLGIFTTEVSSTDRTTNE